jgi:hypothetical protein
MQAQMAPPPCVQWLYGAHVAPHDPCPQFEANFPFRSAAQVAAGQLPGMFGGGSSNSSSGRNFAGAGGSYQLTFLDENLLIGRAFAGVFIFTRTEDDVIG